MQQFYELQLYIRAHKYTHNAHCSYNNNHHVIKLVFVFLVIKSIIAINTSLYVTNTMVSWLSHQLVKNTIILLRQNDSFTHWLNENEEEEEENWTLLYVCNRCYPSQAEYSCLRKIESRAWEWQQNSRKIGVSLKSSRMVVSIKLHSPYSHQLT